VKHRTFGGMNMGNVKFNWNIYMKDHFIVIDLNDGCNAMIDTRYPETLEKNKKDKKEEIEQWSKVNKTTVEGMHLLD
jgi:hypothetical protein